MAHLRYTSRHTAIRLSDADPRVVPCLFVPERRPAMVLLAIDGAVIRAFDGSTGATDIVEHPHLRGDLYRFTPIEDEDVPKQHAQRPWFWDVASRFAPLVSQLLLVTFVLNLLALATPLFVMAVYDRVVAAQSLPMLGYFGIGVAIALLCDILLRGVRGWILGFVGARLDNILGNAIFERILGLPPTLTEQSTVGAQLARIKDFESVREFFTGAIALIFLELPFVFLFVVAIAFLGGTLALIPLVMIGLFAGFGWLMATRMRIAVARATRAAAARQEFVVETLAGIRAIKLSNAEDTWLDRFRELSSRSATFGFRTALLSASLQTMAHVFMVSAGAATLCFGVFRILDGDMTVGALIAAMILVWRVLAPLQSAFHVMARLNQVRSSVDQINGLMAMRTERPPHAMVTPLTGLRGRVTFNRVSLRYSHDADPALVGVSFDILPGEIAALVGGNGAGKSTILKLILSTYTPQGGSVRIDNRDIRQLDPVELRHAIGYVPQEANFFYGTIAQNLRFVHPVSTDGELHAALAQAGVLHEVSALEQGSGQWRRSGVDVRIGDTASIQLPTSLQQGLNLSRAYIKRAPVLLMDEPGVGLDRAGDEQLMRMLRQLRGNTTIIMVTHRPSHLSLTDKIIWLEGGQVRAAGPTDQVLPHLPGTAL